MKIEYFSANPESPASGYWDQALLSDIFSYGPLKNLEANNGAVVAIPGPYQAGYISKINEYLGQYKWVLLFITSDEEGKFPIEKIDHPNIRIWVQYPKQKKHDKYGKLPLGYTSETRKNLVYTDKTLDLFYSGQRTHKRREECSDALFVTKKKIRNQLVLDTEGFSQGLKPVEYMANMSNAKVAPAPSGPISADSFRCYEALEAGAVPIADQISLAGDHDYFNYLFESVPFPTIKDYHDLPGYIDDALKAWPENALNIQAWWIKKKRDLMWSFHKDIRELCIESGKTLIEETGGYKFDETAIATEKNAVTVIIPVSPIKSHPSTAILEETISSIRYHLPDSEIIITFDGVREEQKDMTEKYDDFMRRALFLCNTVWNATPIIFKEHTHQVGMARVALEEVKTPVVLYVEQDTPLVIDEPIDWDFLVETILRNEANAIRFHFEAKIPKAHEHLMLSEIIYNADPKKKLLETIQWSQRPHLAHTSFYKYILAKNFSENARCFIEDKLHSVVQEDYQLMGKRGWDIWKLFIYCPDEKNIKRSLNLDGRDGGEKYDDTQQF